jgi:hypothetical protein
MPCLMTLKSLSVSVGPALVPLPATTPSGVRNPKITVAGRTEND